MSLSGSLTHETAAHSIPMYTVRSEQYEKDGVMPHTPARHRPSAETKAYDRPDTGNRIQLLEYRRRRRPITYQSTDRRSSCGTRIYRQYKCMRTRCNSALVLRRTVLRKLFVKPRLIATQQSDRRYAPRRSNRHSPEWTW